MAHIQVFPIIIYQVKASLSLKYSHWAQSVLWSIKTSWISPTWPKDVANFGDGLFQAAQFMNVGVP